MRRNFLHLLRRVRLTDKHGVCSENHWWLVMAGNFGVCSEIVGHKFGNVHIKCNNLKNFQTYRTSMGRKHVLWSSETFTRPDRYLSSYGRDEYKNACPLFIGSVRYFCPIWTKTGMCLQISVGISCTKFQENPIKGFCSFIMRADRQTDSPAI
jgi:hypothetical protein